MDQERSKLASKVTKRSVDYSRGMKATHCGICQWFEKPDGCHKVAGRIDPEYWCRLFRIHDTHHSPAGVG